jgi:hypothetical protein
MFEATLDRQTIAKRGTWLSYFTIAWNNFECLIAIVAGTASGSISLVGFGIDSFIEVVSGATLLWRMTVDADVKSREQNERFSVKVVGGCFCLWPSTSLMNLALISLAEKPLGTALQESFWPAFLLF